MRKILILLVILNLLGCKSLNKNNSATNKKTEEVSLIAVIANPEKYHKKRIVIKGYFTMETEGQAIYVSKNDYEKGIFKNSIYLYIGYDSLKEMNIEEPYKGYVQIEGIFDKQSKGGYGFSSGGLRDITIIERLYKKGTLTDEYDTD